MVTPAKIAAVVSTWSMSTGAMLAQGLVQQTPNQMAWVLAGIGSTVTAVTIVLVIYHKITSEMDARALAKAKEVVHLAIEDHAKEAAERTKKVVSETVERALKQYASEGTSALREHTFAEERRFDAILEELTIQRAQNEGIIDTLRRMRNDSSPGLKSLANMPSSKSTLETKK